MNFHISLNALIFCLCFWICIHGSEVDVSWDFDSDLDGWASASASDMNVEVRIEDGELKGSITGWNPFIDSPQMFQDITPRHYLAIRMAYRGASTKSQFLLRSGAQAINPELIDSARPYWSNNLIMNPILGSEPSNQNTDITKLSDSDPYSYYLSNSSTGVSIDFDLIHYRWITAIKILPIGDNRTPQRFLLQKSLTSGIGPFVTVASFTIPDDGYSNSSFIDPLQYEEKIFRGFSDVARYWKIVIINNYGGNGIGIREIQFAGYDDHIAVVPFTIDNTGSYQTYYLPLYKAMLGQLLRMRLSILEPEKNPRKNLKSFQEGLAIDYIRIMRAPEIWRIRGCNDQYSKSRGPIQLYQAYNVTSHLTMINDVLPIRSYVINNMTLPYAGTYNCPLAGNIFLTIEGINFGINPLVYIDQKPCIVRDIGTYPVSADDIIDADIPIDFIVCRLPSNSSPGRKTVRVVNGDATGLFQESLHLSYRIAPSIPMIPNIANIASHRMDLVWNPPGDPMENMVVTGYKILWFSPSHPDQIFNTTVGNVTTTSIRGLQPHTEYVFAMAAVSEEPITASTLPTDLYGRRMLLDHAFIGEFSAYTNVTATGDYEFQFHFFNANSTLNGSTISDSLQSDGPTGLYGSEGSYGLAIVGSANIENCNVSSTCCDGYDPTIGLSSCGIAATVCAVLPSRSTIKDYVIDGSSRQDLSSNMPSINGALPQIVILPLSVLIKNKGTSLPNVACGPSLRLTPSAARQAGAVWYRRKVNIEEGFDTRLKFRISNPSYRCNRLDDVSTFCRSRGADGFAFVVQDIGLLSLGTGGSGLGYEGMNNALAVEVDTFMNYDQLDFYENHIAVMTQGWRFNITANHSRSLGTTTNVPDLTDGIHELRIKYDPIFDDEAISHPSFQANGFSSWFYENADFQYGGEGDWGQGVGLLYVYIDDMYSPVLMIPINLQATLKLDHGRAYVGLTGATGDNHWQVHDILNWNFQSLYRNKLYYEPIIVNGIGDHRCVNETVCVHRSDYVHYLRNDEVP